MAVPFMHARFRGKEYELDVTDLTNRRLIKMKGWFGEQYGAFNGLPRLMSQYDSAAWACALWIGQEKHGYPMQDPREMDFHFDEFEFINDEPEKEDADADDPKADDAETPASPIPDSASTASSDSKTSTSSPSSKPESPRKK